MKQYEYVSRHYLTRRTPVIIRIDGRAFHSFTRGFERPFDEVLVRSMQRTMKYLCENIQGCVLGYTQSDEITLVLIDYQNLDSSAWFDNNIQKLCSISASIATMAFNRFFAEEVKNYAYNMERDPETGCLDPQQFKQHAVYIKAIDKGAMFDSRAFNIPKEEVANVLFWRQDDASKNSIQMVGQANFSHKELQHKSRSDIQDMLMLQKNINWNNYPTHLKRGSCCVRKFDDTINRTKWVVDTEIPIFKGEGRSYIEDLIFV